MRILFAIVQVLSVPALASSQSSHLVDEWNSAALTSTQDSGPLAARALAIISTCMYDAWAAYDDRAIGTELSGALRRPPLERTQTNKEKAISYAAYRALVDLFPAENDSSFKPLMKHLGYDPTNRSSDIETPVGIGNVACAAVLESRHRDKSNQLGDLGQGPYSDWTHFRPVNMPAPFPPRLPSIHPIDMNHWQPLIYVDSKGNFETQMFSAAQWCYVTSFALSRGDEFRELAKEIPAAVYGSPEYHAQAEELVRMSAGLSDQQKVAVEYWSGVRDGESSAAHWNRFAQWISDRDHHSIDDDVKMFFALNNALLDADIAAWDMKREFDSIRPITAITALFSGTKIRSWGGPGKGTVEIDGSHWIPYQPAVKPTPPTPEYVSEDSAEAAAAAAVLIAWTGADHFGYAITVAAHSSKIEPGITPAQDTSLRWSTFTEAADGAGLSGRWGGTHFRNGDLAGRKLGRLVGEKAWTKVQFLLRSDYHGLTTAQTETHR